MSVGVLHVTEKIQTILKHNQELNKLYGDKLDFKDIKFPVKVRDIHLIRKNPSILVFLVKKIRKKIFNLCVKQMLWRQTCWFIILLISEGKNHLGRKHLCRYFFQAFENMWEKKVIIYDLANHNQEVTRQITKKSQIIRRQLTIYDLRRFLKKYQNKYQSHAAYSYGHKLVSVVEKVKPLKSCLAKNTVYNFINSIVEETKHCSDVRKKHFNKEI